MSADLLNSLQQPLINPQSGAITAGLSGVADAPSAWAGTTATAVAMRDPSPIASLWTGPSVFAQPALGAQSDQPPTTSPIWSMIQAINANNQRQRPHSEWTPAELVYGFTGPGGTVHGVHGSVPEAEVLSTSTDSLPPLVEGPRRPAQPQQPEVVPVIFDGNNATCTICGPTDNTFAPGNRVCRLRCRHIFHATCWNEYHNHADASRAFRGDCPNCRGRGDVIAIWNYIDPNLVTQYLPDGTGRQVSNDMAVDQSVELTTPRSVATEYPFDTPDSHASPTPTFGTPNPPVSAWEEMHRMSGTASTSTYTGSFHGIVLPNTYWDAQDWIASSGFGSPSGRYLIPPSAAPPAGQENRSYHLETRLPDGKPALLLDIGSVGNLAGDAWVKDQATVAVDNKRKPEQYKRERPLSVSGVGNGSQSCEFNCRLPIAIPNQSGKFTKGTFDTPTVPKSMLPALLGLDSTRRCRGIIDTNTLVLHLCGPGDYDLMAALPAGTESIQCKIAPSGHMVIPCAEFAELDKRQRYGGLEVEHEVALPAVVEEYRPPLGTPEGVKELAELRRRCAELEEAAARPVSQGSGGTSSSGEHSLKPHTL